MPVVQPLPLVQTLPPNPKVLPQPYPSEEVNQSERLCWVHRRSKTSHRQYLWPALYYDNWVEACHELSRVLTPQQNKKLCLDLLSRVKLSAEPVVAKLIFGSDQMEFVEITRGDNALFGQFFGGYFAQALEAGSEPSYFDQDKEWYDDFRQALVQAVSLFKGNTTSLQKGHESEQEQVHESGQEHAADLISPSTPGGDVFQEVNLTTTGPDPSSQAATVSPTLFQQETPTHANKSVALPAAQPKQQRALFSSSSSSGRKNAVADKVTRPRRKAVQQIDDSTASSPKHHFSDECDDHFYHFPYLMKFLTQKLGWKYRKAGDGFHNWVYERGNTAGEKGRKVLEDYFYEEKDVVDYCRAHKYKEEYQHLLAEDTKFFITPSPRKKNRIA